VPFSITYQIEKFFDWILASPLMDMMSEYSQPGNPIQRGNRQPSVYVTKNDPSGTTLTQQQVRDTLKGWIADPSFPQPTANTLYFIYLPPSAFVTVGPYLLCTNAGGYHDTTALNGTDLYFAVVATCTSTTALIDSLTAASTHELMEAIVDASTDGLEVGDNCVNYTARMGGSPAEILSSRFALPPVGPFLVQAIWSQQQNACAYGPPAQLQSLDLPVNPLTVSTALLTFQLQAYAFVTYAGTVTLTAPAPVAGVNITMTSSDESLVFFENNQVAIPGGSTTGQFIACIRCPNLAIAHVTITATSSIGTVSNVLNIRRTVAPVFHRAG
jgi:hypothetical protein